LFISILYLIFFIACPDQWWPLTFYSTSVSLITEVIKGDNINAIAQVSTAGDRFLATNNAAIYIKGANGPATTAAAYTSYLTLPAGSYFCSTAFTITFWINVQTPLGLETNIARVLDFSDTTAKANGIAVYLEQGTTNTNTAVVLETVVGSATAKTASVTNDAGFAVSTWKHVAITVSSSSASTPVITVVIYYDGVKQTTTGTITLPTSCPNFANNFIGKGAKPSSTADVDVNLDAYLNDVKIFNSALSESQVSTQFTAEKCNVFF